MANVKIKKLANVFYHQTLLEIGGCETYEVETITKYASLGYDIDFYYKKCLNDKYLELISNAIGTDHVHEYNGEVIYCNTLFVNYDFEGFLENVYADKVVNVIHANFMLQKFSLHDSPKITKRIAVSEENAKAYKERFGLKCDVCYNPITIRKEDTRRVLNIISATRLTEEKGKPRMIKLMKLLEEKNIPYYWHIFTNQKNDIKNPNVIYHEPTLDIRPYINNADYLVQLSSSEGYCYSVLESLCMGTPVIVTDLPIFKEMGVINGINGFILPLDMKNVPIDEIYHKKLSFSYEPKKDRYDKYLTKEKTKYVEEEIMKVKVIKPFKDLEEKVHYVKPEKMVNEVNPIDGWKNIAIPCVIDVRERRAKEIVDAHYGEYVEKKTKKRGK